MAKTIVDATGQMRTIVDSRKVQLEKQYDAMEEALRKEEIVFTRRWLMSTYGLRTPDFWAFLKLMESREVLAAETSVPHKVGSRVTFTEKRWKIVARPGTPATFYPSLFPGKTQSKSERRRFRNTHLCDRCGSLIPGKGRHRKSTRGHTRDKCDLAMVKVIHEA